MRMVLLIGAAAVWIGALVYYGRRLSHGNVSFRLRAVLVGLRSVSLVGILVLLFHPVMARESRVERPLHLVFLLDDSASMALPAAGVPGSRLDRARRILFDSESGLVAVASRKGLEGRVLGLSDHGYVASAEECSASAEVTDLAGALDWVRGFGLDQDVAAVVLLTDGRHTSAGDPVRSASQTDFPVFAIGFGATQAVTDLAVTQLSVPPSIPSGETFEVRAIVEIEAPVEATLTAQYLMDGQRVETAQAEVGSGSRRVTFVAEMTAGDPGPHEVAFRVEPLANEQVVENNERSRILAVEKARLGVTVLAGRPAWEFKFLRRSIEESERLIGTYIFPRGGGGTVVLRDGAQSEGEAGVERVKVYPERSFSAWTELLDSSDAVIVQNLPASRLEPEWAGALHRWLGEEDRVLLFLGGDQAFGAGGYGNSGLSDFLPVRCAQTDDRMVQEHLLRFPQNGGELFPYQPFGQFSFDQVPPVLALHRFAGVKAGSEILLEGLGSGGEVLPALVVHRSGLGYVAAAGWDSLWRWQILGKDRDLLGRFWRTLILFFLTGEKTGPAALSVSDSSFRSGQPIRVWMYLSSTLLGEDLPDRVRLLLSGESTHQRPVYLYPSPGEANRYQGVFSIQSPGAHTLTYRLGNVQGTKTLVVEADSHERDSLSQDAQLLARVAEAGGGTSLAPGRATDLLDLIEFKPRYEVTMHYTFVGRLPWVIFALVGVFTLEWVVRRWHMLP